MSLPARIEGVLVQERIDLLYRSHVGHVAVVCGLDNPDQHDLRAGMVALALEATTVHQPAAVQIVVCDASSITVQALSAAIQRARSELKLASRTAAGP